MCHFDQNSLIVVEKCGDLKLSINSIFNNPAEPLAISEYPEKSQYISIEKKKAANTKAKPSYYVNPLYTLSTITARLSATTIFLKNPQAISFIPLVARL